MAKSRIRKKKKKTTTTKSLKRITTRTKSIKKRDMSIVDEIKYIIKCAGNFTTKIVSIGELILFCTESGDAWILDTDDNCALNLARDGEKLEFTAFDTPDQFLIDWKYSYLIENEKFMVIDHHGMARTIIGYPTQTINELIHKRK